MPNPTPTEPPATDPPPIIPLLLTKGDAAVYLGVSLRTLNRIIAAEDIDVVRINGRGSKPASVRFTRAALDDYAHRHTDRAAANRRRNGTK